MEREIKDGFWTVRAGVAKVPPVDWTVRVYGRSLTKVVLFRLLIKSCHKVFFFISSFALPLLPLWPVHWQVTVTFYSFTIGTLTWQHAAPLNPFMLVLTRLSPRCFHSLEPLATTSSRANSTVRSTKLCMWKVSLLWWISRAPVLTTSGQPEGGAPSAASAASTASTEPSGNLQHWWR